MPMHDWNRVEAGIFHAFHHGWISAISDTLNRGFLPADFYALPEQVFGNTGPDVLTLQVAGDADRDDSISSNGALSIATMTRPRTRFVQESDKDFYRRKKSSVVVRHVSGDRVVAVVEIVSPGNKSGRAAFKQFVDKACALLERRVHLLIADPFPPTPRDPHGVHAAIWEEFQDAEFELPGDKPLTLVAYECDLVTRAFVEPIAVDDTLPDMPIFLEPDRCIMAPLEATYQTAFDAMPRRWKSVLASKVT